MSDNRYTDAEHIKMMSELLQLVKDEHVSGKHCIDNLSPAAIKYYKEVVMPEMVANKLMADSK